jgi:ABC-type Zn uptake system ZnuABC Zn-binding protein ZnuA
MHKTYEYLGSRYHLQQEIPQQYNFHNLVSLEQIENQVKRETQSDNSHIYYYFGVSEDYPQYVLLMYMYKDKKPIR